MDEVNKFIDSVMDIYPKKGENMADTEQVKEVTVKEAFTKFMRRLLINEKGELSLMKIGGFAFSVCLLIEGMPAAHIYPPHWLIVAALIGKYVGMFIGFVGWRDAKK